MTRHLAALLLALVALGACAGTASATGNFENTTQITINDSGKANPYPSAIDVDGQTGVITEVTVGLRGLKHSHPTDIDLLLVSPSGTAVVLMSDVCGGNEIVDATWTFNQRFGAPMAVGSACGNILHRPTNAGAAVDNWPGAPDVPVTADLHSLIGENPNGRWSLYAWDDESKDSGKILRGWSLGLDTREPVAVVPAPGGPGTASPYPLTKTVSGLDGVVERVSVTIGGLYHERPADLDVLLVGPQGQNVMLMSDACGVERARDTTLTWRLPTINGMPSARDCPTDFVWFPTDYGTDDVLPPPAPPRPYGTRVENFDYTDPNGDWRLYVNDDTPGSAHGFFTHFSLDVKTRPRADVALQPARLELPEGETRQLTLFRQSGGKGFGDGTVTVASTPLSATSGTDYAPVKTTVALPSATQEVTVPVRALADDLPEDVETFAVSLEQPTGDAAVAAGAPPTVVSIADRTPRPVEDAGDPVDPGPGTGGEPQPGGGGPQPEGGGPVADRVAPAVGPLVIRKAGRGRRTVRFLLSEPAALTVRVMRGRRTVRTVRLAGRAGLNRVSLRRGLRRGSYRVLVTAVDAAGNRSRPRSRRLRVA